MKHTPIGRVALTALIVALLLGGCSLRGPNVFSKIGGWFKSPTERMERAQEKEDVLKSDLFEQAHEGIYAAGKALENPDSVKAQGVAVPFAKTALDAMDSARGPLLPKMKTLLELRVEQLTNPLESEANIEAQAWMLKWRGQVADNAQAKAGWAAEREGLQGKVIAAAKKWEGFMSLVMWIAIGYVLFAWIFPIVGKLWKPFAPVASFTQSILTPAMGMAYRSTKAVAKDLVGAIHEIRNDVLKAVPDVKAKADAVLGEYVTEADGTAAKVDEIRRESGLL